MVLDELTKDDILGVAMDVNPIPGRNLICFTLNSFVKPVKPASQLSKPNGKQAAPVSTEENPQAAHCDGTVPKVAYDNNELTIL
ncbi:hypothetical protein QYF36_008747 [Acer negundo]|nr:hypothetical protein QYF36_008747 [Acer negundo]